jgi:LysR family transcriptional activator of nhaA
LDEQSVSLIGKPEAVKAHFKFPDDLQFTPLLLPSMESEIRAAFNFLMEQANIRPFIAAEVDDMAMLRLLVRESNSLALVPPVVVRDELNSGMLVEHYCIPDILEHFYAITPSRRFPNSLLKELLAKHL